MAYLGYCTVCRYRVRDQNAGPKSVGRSQERLSSYLCWTLSTLRTRSACLLFPLLFSIPKPAITSPAAPTASASSPASNLVSKYRLLLLLLLVIFSPLFSPSLSNGSLSTLLYPHPIAHGSITPLLNHPFVTSTKATRIQRSPTSPPLSTPGTVHTHLFKATTTLCTSRYFLDPGRTLLLFLLSKGNPDVLGSHLGQTFLHSTPWGPYSIAIPAPPYSTAQ